MVNTIFPLKLLEISAKFKTPIFINTDTYFNKNSIPYQGLVNYSLSKYQFKEWGKQFGTDGRIFFINAQLEHLFGPGDADSKFTTYIIKSLLKNIDKLELTPGEQKRDFISVDNVVSAYLVLIEKACSNPQMYQHYEVGTGQSLSIREFVETAHRLIEAKTELVFGAKPYREDEIMFSQANIKPLIDLGWQPNLNFQHELLQTIEYEKNNMFK